MFHILEQISIVIQFLSAKIIQKKKLKKKWNNTTSTDMKIIDFVNVKRLQTKEQDHLYTTI